MAKVTPNTGRNLPSLRPGLTPEADENQMIALAMSLVEKRLRDGSASSQETTHFLKLATTKARLENQLLEAQTAMAIAKKEALESQKRSEEMFREAIAAFKSYSGHGEEVEEEEYDEY
jgi:hypothetical protein